MFQFRIFLISNVKSLIQQQSRAWRRKGARRPIYEERLDYYPKVNPLAKCEKGESVPDVVISPYAPEKTVCVACKYRLDFNYKNTRLLSQFLSSFTGRLYDKHQTGLCDFQQHRLRTAVWYARRAALMPIFNKEPRFLKDPRLFDPMTPIRPNPYSWKRWTDFGLFCF